VLPMLQSKMESQNVGIENQKQQGKKEETQKH
jgi:hypothetical protein